MKLSTNNSVKYDEVNEKLAEVKNEIGKVIVGQEDVIEQVLTCILCDGNILLESNPGMGKTKMASTISKTMGMEFSRIQSTPDLMPSDITGTHIVDESSGKAEFIFQQGPIFSNMVLVDEINRATPKTQSALLEAMQEKQVTVGNNSYSLEKPFFLIATQNPIEQEGSLHPDESVYMDGGLWKASDALQHAKSNGKVVHSGDDMTLYDAGNTTQTFDSQGKIKESRCMVYEKEYEGEIYSVKTKTGRRIEVSGNHPFLVNDGGI